MESARFLSPRQFSAPRSAWSFHSETRRRRFASFAFIVFPWHICEPMFPMVIRQTEESSGDLTASPSSCETTSLTRKIQVGAPRFSRKYSLTNSYSWLLVEAKQKCLLFEIPCSFLIYFRANFNLGSSQAINYHIWSFGYLMVPLICLFILFTIFYSSVYLFVSSTCLFRSSIVFVHTHE